MNHFKTRGVKSMRALCVFFGMAGTLFATDPVPADPDLTKGGKNMIDFRAGQAKIATAPELKGTIGYARTAPFWYPELDDLPRKVQGEEGRVRNAAATRVKEQMKDKPERGASPIH